MRIRSQLLICFCIAITAILTIRYARATLEDRNYAMHLSNKFKAPDFDGTETSCRCKDLHEGDRRLHWPPTRVPGDLTCADGIIDLTMCVLLNKSHGARTADNTPQSSNLLSSSEDWLRLGKSARYDLYPLAVNATEIVDELTHGRLVILRPITNPNIRLIRHSRNICSPNNLPNSYKLVIIYKSNIFHFKERKRIREFYGDLRADIGVVFVTGRPASSSPTQSTMQFHHQVPMNKETAPQAQQKANHFHMNGGYELRLPERAGATAEVWGARDREAMERLLVEANIHDDLIVGDFVDTYVNLTYKMLTSHRWASAFCQGKTDTFLFLDDDFQFNANNVMSYLASLSRPERRQLLSGPRMVWRRVIRPFRDARRNKWALSLAEMPWDQYPPYVSGAAYFMGAEVLKEVVITEAYTRFLWVDDAYLGFVVAKLPNRRFAEMKGFYLESMHNFKALVTHWPVRFTLQWLMDTLRQLGNSLRL